MSSIETDEPYPAHEPSCPSAQSNGHDVTNVSAETRKRLERNGRERLSFPRMASYDAPMPRELTPTEAWEEAWEHPFFVDAPGWLKKESARIPLSFGSFGGDLLCIDEGVEPEEGEDAVYLAGSGILYKKNQIKDPNERRKALATQLRGKNITGVRSHCGCGACALFAQEMGLGNVEKIAQEWGRRLAEDLGVPYKGHVEPVRRPKKFHNALIAYYDGTGRFEDPARAGLPPGFTYSRGILDDAEQGAFELDLARQIAMGAHGFGERFTPDHPFHLAVIGDPDRKAFSEDFLLQEADAIAKRHPNVRVIALRAPKAK